MTGGGANASDIGTITRSNGTKQVTYKRHPLDYFEADRSAGSTSGQGSGADCWARLPSPACSSYWRSLPSPPRRACLHTDIPGVSVAHQFASQTMTRVVGVGVAVSIGGVMLCEYLALTRLVHAIGRVPVCTSAAAIGGLVVLGTPFSLIDPEGFYNTLATPSLIALWASQLIVFLAYPRFAYRRGQPLAAACAHSLVASGLAVYGLVMSLHAASR